MSTIKEICERFFHTQQMRGELYQCMGKSVEGK